MRDVIIYSRMEGYSVNCVCWRLAKLNWLHRLRAQPKTRPSQKEGPQETKFDYEGSPCQ